MKKIYLKPSTIEVKLEACRLLSASDDAKVYNEVSTNGSYSREGRGFFDDDED